LVALSTLAAPGYSQSTETDVPDRFLIELGGFNIGADSHLTLSSGQGGGTTIDFERDLDLPDRATTSFVGAYWRVGRRHLVHLDFARLSREGGGRTLDREINWGGVVYPVGLRAQGAVDSDYVSGTYRFAAYRNETFEIGPALGFGYVWVTARLQVQATAGSVTVDLPDREASSGSVTGNLGAYFRWWPVRRLLVRGDFRYIAVNPGESEAELVDAGGGLTYYPWKNAGIGVLYSYDKLRYDRGILARELGGSYRYSGFQVLASFAF
jgi:hypothetical protein